MLYIFCELLFLLSQNNFSWALERTRLFHENEDPRRDYNVSFKGRNPRILESRPDYGSLLLSFSRPFLSLAIPFAYAAGEVNSGRVCLHFHCLCVRAVRRRHRRRRRRCRRGRR